MLSIPSGTSEVAEFTALIETCRQQGLEVFEGAENNLPDLQSETAARPQLNNKQERFSLQSRVCGATLCSLLVV